MKKTLKVTVTGIIAAALMLSGLSASAADKQALSGNDLYEYYMQTGEVPSSDDMVEQAVSSQSSNARTIIGGTDERQLVTDTTVHPYKSIGLLFVENEDTGNTYGGTCFAFAKNAFLTSAHCFYHNSKELTFVKIELGVNADMKKSERVIIDETPAEIIICEDFKTSPSASTDWAIILFDSNVASSYFGFSDNASTDETVSVTGYPGAGTVEADGSSGGVLRQMWTASGNLTLVKDKYIRYEMDTTSGQSGSPVYAYRSGQGYKVVGIHRGGSSANGYNHARRIYGDLYSLMAKIRAGTYTG